MKYNNGLYNVSIFIIYYYIWVLPFMLSPLPFCIHPGYTKHNQKNFRDFQGVFITHSGMWMMIIWTLSPNN